mmetsp:Transcript_19534/g.63423  ORF Transcript_19534/g.63423 Transcript_19534/m.63423 type:complete len:204 (+) Transcript_19534:111-722(+)
MSSSGSASGACGSPDVPPPEAEGESTLSAAPLSPAVLRAPCWSGSAGGGGPPAAGGGGGGGPSSAGGGGPSSASGGGCPAAPPPCPPPSPCTVAWATEEGRPAGGCSCGGLARTMKLHPAAPPPAPPPMPPPVYPSMEHSTGFIAGMLAGSGFMMAVTLLLMIPLLTILAKLLRSRQQKLLNEATSDSVDPEDIAPAHEMAQM